jgi:hypothetical protein
VTAMMRAAIAGLGLTPFVTGLVPCFRSVGPGARSSMRDQPDEQ